MIDATSDAGWWLLAKSFVIINAINDEQTSYSKHVLLIS